MMAMARLWTVFKRMVARDLRGGSNLPNGVVCLLAFEDIARFGGCSALGWKETELLSDPELHAVNLGQEAGYLGQRFTQAVISAPQAQTEQGFVKRDYQIIAFPDCAALNRLTVEISPAKLPLGYDKARRKDQEWRKKVDAVSRER